MSKKKKDNKSDTDKADTKKGSGKRGNQSESVSKPVNKSVKARKRVVIKHRRRVKSKVDKELLKGTIGGAKKERSRKAKGKVVKKKKLLSPKALLASKKKKRKKTRKKSKKLKRSGESNRYQSIVKMLKGCIIILSGVYLILYLTYLRIILLTCLRVQKIFRKNGTQQ
tara:strand:+ start:79 stop:582 length:504 start_codon:yes stop_codon:yes gene_type:complete